MRLFKIENHDEVIWYFTTKAKIAKYIGSSPTYVDICLKLGKRCKDWSIEEIESGDVLSIYIDPER